MKRLFLLLLTLSPAALAQTTIFTSDFNGNTGAVVLAGNTDNTSGAASLGVTWTQHPSVTHISELTSMSTGDSGTVGGFAQLQNGTATYANANNAYISRNHNLDTNHATSKRGYSFTFTIDDTWDLTTLDVISGHTNNTGLQDQDFASKLNLSISGGTLGSPITASRTEEYGTPPAYHTVIFNLGGNTLGAGTYTVQVYQSDMPGAGAYAMYDGITLNGNNGAPPGPTIEFFTADDHYVTPGSSLSFSWVTDGATALTLDPGNIDLLLHSTDGDGSTSITIDSTTTYTLTATNTTNSVTMKIGIVTGPPRPNILFFLVDDMGTNDTSVPFLTDTAGNDVPSAANSLYRTPNMESLASRGMKFTRAYSMPVCTPSRVSIMTGMNSARHHITNWTDVVNAETGQNSTPSHRSPSGWRTQGLEVTPNLLPKLLGSAGYRSIHVGKAHFGNQPGVNIDPRDIGFDVNIAGKETGRPGSYHGTSNFGSGTYHVPDLDSYHGQDIFLTEALTLEMNNEIEKSVNAGVPFFAYMSHYAIHDPYDTDNRFAANYPTLSGNAKSFATLLEGMDKSLGDIIAKLNALGVAENTLVIFMSDNGSTLPRPDDPRRGYKGQKYEGGTRVPMIVGWGVTNADNPHQAALNIPTASRTTDLVSITDIFPTILAAAGIPVPTIPLDGSDLSPYLRGLAGHQRPQELLIHFPHDHNGAWGDYYSVFHDGDYKLIYNYPSNSYELYHLADDPHEDTNLAASEPARVMTMARKMARQLSRETAQWPRFSSNNADDPHAMPNLPGIDLDHDGIDDNAEDPNFNGLLDPGEIDPDNPDSDSDGTQDGTELKIGTDPLDATSFFRAILTKHPDGSMRLTWPSKPGHFFHLVAGPQPGIWTETLASQLPANSSGSETHYDFGPSSSATRFFRVSVE